MPLPESFVDGRIPSKPAGPPVSPNAPLAFLGSEFMQADDPPSGSICAEIDVERHDVRNYVETDSFTGERRVEQRTIRSGNDSIVFAPASDYQLRGRWMRGRDMGCRYRPEIEEFFHFDCESIPGQMICIDENCAYIIDRLALAETKEFWLKLRRLAGSFKKWPFAIGSGIETKVYPFRSKSDWWTWCWYLRLLVDQGVGKTGPRMVREYQNLHMLPSREDIAKSNKARIKFLSPAFEWMLKRDLWLRQQKLENGGQYAYDGHMTSALAGCAEHDVDFHSVFADVN